MAVLTVMPSPKFEGFDANGDPLNGGLLYTYVAGTSTPLSTYTTSAGTVANANPVVLDSAGRATVYLSPVSYKFELKTAAGVTVWTQDNVSAAPPATVDLDVPGTAGETLTAGQAVYLSDGTGGRTAGRWYLTDADLTYASVTAQALGFVVADITSGDSGSIRQGGRMTGLAGLTAGSVYYISATAGAITSSAPTNARPVAVADSTTSIVIASSTGAASSTQAGIVSLGTQTLGSGTKTVDALTVTGLGTFGITPTFKPGTSADADARVNGRIYSDFTTVGNVGAGTDDLMSYTVKANVLAVDGQVVRFKGAGTFAANANSKQMFFVWGATTLTFSASTNTDNGFWEIVVDVMRTAAATQRLVGRITWGDSETTNEGYHVLYTTSAATLSGTVATKFQGAATTNNDITQTMMTVEVIG